jgi:hypothetical protein
MNSRCRYDSRMTNDEEKLLALLEVIPYGNAQAMLVQNFIAEHGFLSEEAGAKVREILKRK